MLNLTKPLKGNPKISRGFEAHRSANPGTWYGIDYAVPTGTDLIAVEDGTVSNAQKITTGGGWNFRLNLTKYPNWFVWYAHCSAIPSNGQVFKRGQVIGKSGNTGFSTGSHLHMSLMSGLTPVDPDNKNNVTWEEVDTVVTEEDKFRVAFITVQQDIAKQADINAWASSGKTPTDYVQRTFLFPIYEGFNKQIKDLNTRVVDLKKQLASQPTTGPSEIDVSKLKRINFTYK